MTDKQLLMLHSPYRVVEKDYDEGHGGPVPTDYMVQNNKHRICTVQNNTEAKSIRDTYNQMRITLLKQLLEEATT